MSMLSGLLHPNGGGIFLLLGEAPETFGEAPETFGELPETFGEVHDGAGDSRNGQKSPFFALVRSQNLVTSTSTSFFFAQDIAEEFRLFGKSQ